MVPYLGIFVRTSNSEISDALPSLMLKPFMGTCVNMRNTENYEIRILLYKQPTNFAHTMTYVSTYSRHKNGDPHVVTNYRPVSLLSILLKVLKRCIYSHCYEFMQHKLSFYQHGFVQGRNCTTQLVWFYHKILEALDNGMGMR